MSGIPGPVPRPPEDGLKHDALPSEEELLARLSEVGAQDPESWPEAYAAVLHELTEALEDDA